MSAYIVTEYTEPDIIKNGFIIGKKLENTIPM